MPARRKTGAVRRPTRRKAQEALARLQSELPPTLADFSRRVRRELTVLERRVEKAAAPARREIARVLREASHALGRYEAEGERQWKRLAGEARREALVGAPRSLAELAAHDVIFNATRAAATEWRFRAAGRRRDVVVRLEPRLVVNEVATPRDPN